MKYSVILRTPGVECTLFVADALQFNTTKDFFFYPSFDCFFTLLYTFPQVFPLLQFSQPILLLKQCHKLRQNRTLHACHDCIKNTAPIEKTHTLYTYNVVTVSNQILAVSKLPLLFDHPDTQNQFQPIIFIEIEGYRGI